MQRSLCALFAIVVVTTVGGCATDPGAARARATAELNAQQETEVARTAETSGEVSGIDVEKDGFQARALTRLDMLHQKIMNLRELARESKKPNSIIDSVIVDTSALRDDVQALSAKLPAVVEVTSEETWDLTKNDLNGQIKDLEARYLALSDLI